MLDASRARAVAGWIAVALVVALGVVTLIDGYSRSSGLKWIQFLSVIGLGAIVIGGVVVLALVQLADWRSPASDAEFDALVERSEALAGFDSFDSVGALEGDFDVPEDDAGVPDDDADGPDDDADGPDDDEEFRALVRAAVDQLPIEFHRALEHVAIVVSDGGADVRVGHGRRGAYGMYQGDTVARDYFHDRILIFRDTLMRDFGHDPVLLRAQITRTVRHELAHHLGWDERGVRDLGL